MSGERRRGRGAVVPWWWPSLRSTVEGAVGD